MTTLNGPVLSDFGAFCLRVGAGPLSMHKFMRDTYKRQGNPEGIINLSVAENTLMHDELKHYFEKNFRLRALDFTYGDGLTGTIRLCTAVSGFLNSRFKPWRKVEPEHLVLGDGLLTLLGQVGRAVANHGDGILIAAPYYPGFDICFEVEHGLKPIPVPMNLDEIGTMNELEQLERVLLKSQSSGTTVKAVLLCNPHNPLGLCYPREVIEAYCQFCEKHNLHLLSDEIFAMSIFSSADIPDPVPFSSVLSLDLEKLGVNAARVHVLYGMSKDFNANGFRAGVIISQSNETLIQCLTVTAIFNVIASPTDALWSTLLNDTTYLRGFLEANRDRLREAYNYMTEWLRFHGLPYIPSQATHFLMVDFRPILLDIERYGKLLNIRSGDSMQDRELALLNFLVTKKVLLFAGSKFHTTEGGWFRVSFSVRRDHLDIGFRRLERALGWEGQLEKIPQKPVVPARYFSEIAGGIRVLFGWLFSNLNFDYLPTQNNTRALDHDEPKQRANIEKL